MRNSCKACTKKIYFEKYFPSLEQSSLKFPWLVNPFAVQIEQLDLCSSVEDELIELSCDKVKEDLFSTVDLLTFWSTVSVTYKELGSLALRSLLPFPTTYICELGFSILATVKSKKRNRLNAASDMRVASYFNGTFSLINTKFIHRTRHRSSLKTIL